jgi:hypothetical protein
MVFGMHSVCYDVRFVLQTFMVDICHMSFSNFSLSRTGYHAY